MRIRGRWLINLSLLVVVLLLGGLVALRPGKQAAVKSPLLAVDLGGLSRLTLENGEKVVFERKDGVWRMVEPFAAAVNQARVEQILAIPGIVPAAEYPLPENSARKGYGLSEPFARLSLAGAQLEFGGTAPLDHRRYVQSGEKLYLVDDSFSHQLASKATDFVDKKLIPEESTIRVLKIPGLNLSKSAEGVWASTPALPAEQLQELIMQWSTSRAIEVRRGAPKVLGEKIDLETSMGAIRFSILQKKPELILAREDLDLVFVMTGETAKALLSPVSPNVQQESGALPRDPEHEEDASEHGHEGAHVDE